MFFGSDLRLRSGWAVAVWLGAFACVAAPVYVALTRFAAIPRWIGSELGVLGFAAWLRLLGALFATWVGCAAVRQRFGDAYGHDRHAVARVITGLALGAAAISAVVAVAWAMGSLEIRPSHTPLAEVLRSGGLQALVLFPGSAAEELIVHGFLLQQLVRGTGRIAAIALTSSLFALAHIGNPGLGFMVLPNVALFGALLAVVTVRSGSLWLAVGFHIAWNYTLGFIWGSSISGLHFGGSLLEQVQRATGPWTGGNFIEASLQSWVILTAGIFIAGFWPWKREA